VHVVRVGGARLAAPPVDETPSVTESSPADDAASE
jgi:hypothetical protein